MGALLYFSLLPCVRYLKCKQLKMIAQSKKRNNSNPMSHGIYDIADIKTNRFHLIAKLPRNPCTARLKTCIFFGFRRLWWLHPL